MTKRIGPILLGLLFLGATLQAPICQTSCAIAQSSISQASSQESAEVNQAQHQESPCHGQSAESSSSGSTPEPMDCSKDSCLNQITSQFKYNLKKITQQKAVGEMISAVVTSVHLVGPELVKWSQVTPWFFHVPVRAIYLINQVFRN